MTAPERSITWVAAFAIDLLWLLIAVLSSSTFLILGAALYTGALIPFVVADAGRRPRD